MYDRVSISIHGPAAQTNFSIAEYSADEVEQFKNLGREELQKALGVKPMDKSSRFRGVSKKKGKWEAKVMLNSKWVYRELFDTEEDAARAYDMAVWRLKPVEATSYVNFPDQCPEEVRRLLASRGAGELTSATGQLRLAGSAELGDDGDEQSLSQAESLMDQSVDGLEPPSQRLKKCASDTDRLGLRDAVPVGDSLHLQHTQLLESAAHLSFQVAPVKGEMLPPARGGSLRTWGLGAELKVESDLLGPRGGLGPGTPHVRGLHPPATP